MNYLMVCNTPYQLFNAINILTNDIYINHNNCDLLIDNSFGSLRNEKELGKVLLEKCLCRNVIYARRVIKRHKNKIATFFYLLRNNHLDEYTYSNKDFFNNIYDCVWVGDASPFGYAMYERNENIDIVWYDDGLSSYAEYPRSYGRSKWYEIIMKFLKLGSYKYKPGKLFVNNTDLAKTKEFEVCPLPILNDNNLATKNIENVFHYDIDSSFVKKYKTIVLGQVLDTYEGYNGKEILNIISDAGISPSSFVLRKHPRDKKEYNKYNIDSGVNMWEMECIKGISSSHVLISAFSNALLTPKLIGKKEPYVILLYKLVFDESSPMFSLNNEIAQGIKKMYASKDKVLVPRDLEEFKTIVSKIDMEN